MCVRAAKLDRATDAGSVPDVPSIPDAKPVHDAISVNDNDAKYVAENAVAAACPKFNVQNDSAELKSFFECALLGR